MKIYTGQNSQIGQYLNRNNTFISYNIQDPATWDFLNNAEKIFLIVPKTANTLDDSKKFILACREAGVKHIVKLGSLGPWRVIHNQLNEFIQAAGIFYSNINIAPLMNNVFTEQYNNNILFNYRHNTPAPYLDPKALAQLIEHLMNCDVSESASFSATGIQQYYIDDIRRILEANGYPVYAIEQTHNDKLHKNPSETADQQLMTMLGDDYSKGVYPAVSQDLETRFQIKSRSFEQFVIEDQQYYQKRFAQDKNL